jgi:hypothetical protein
MMNTYELEIQKEVYWYYREIVQAKSRTQALRMLKERLDSDDLEFIEDDEQIVNTQVYKIVSF